MAEAEGDAEGNSQEEICAGCLFSPLEVSLVLTCNHRLCLDCASRNLRAGPSGHEAHCPECQSLTEVDPEAAQHLRKYSARNEKSSNPAIGTPRRNSNSKVSESSILGAGLLGAVRSASASTAEQADSSNAAASANSSEPCGQCQTQKAELDCWQCGEQFCRPCAANVHRAGRMKEHRLTPVGPRPRGTPPTLGDGHARSPSPCAADVSVVSGGGDDRRRGSNSRLSVRSDDQRWNPTTRCVAHPEELAQFFCMDCDSECICAECAVEAAHTGRQVMKVQKAYQSLAGEIDKTLDDLRLRTEDQAQIKREALELKSELDAIIGKGKESIQQAFKQLRVSLAQKETELLAGIDSCEKSANDALNSRVTPASALSEALQEAHVALRKIDTNGDEVRALNTFASVRVTVSQLVDPLVGADGAALVRLLDDLRVELRASLEQQSSGVMALGSRVHEIRRNGGSPGPAVGRP
eukprot:TRINITY_DN74170_c0_g1_i1.p1 TRINITY_DN74170_c0_g1~~TRINITY_DN74170_c0_g1_i1.p1  ORF type:complete len:493 (-),score=74.34 TRINITY_DN74170_c0_g1_i1:292-1692(-)